MPAKPRLLFLSLLFNWPPVGGGNAHTVELCRRLTRFGYNVRHLYARHPPWQIGGCDDSPPFPSEPIDFSESPWDRETIQSRFREAALAWQPDFSLITDAWNFKPHLAAAVEDIPYFLRFDAQECLCPLNNIRLLPNSDGSFRQCTRHQLATPDTCVSCVISNHQYSGWLHALERSLSWQGANDYYYTLRRSLANAECVLAVNPLIAAMIEPYARAVNVVPGGVDFSRFDSISRRRIGSESPQILFPADHREPIKGFAVLKAACDLLWEQGFRFRLAVASDREEGDKLNFDAEFLGWQAPQQFPATLAAADVVVIPSVCQDAMPLTALEAMAAGVPVIASRIGGLQFSVLDGATGRLFEPGNVAQLAEQLTALITDRDATARMGERGRQHVRENYDWDTLIKRHYTPLFG